MKNLDVKIYKVQWRWWWDASEEYFGNYVGSSYRNWVQDTTVSTTGGKATVSFKVEYPDWGRYMIRYGLPSTLM